MLADGFTSVKDLSKCKSDIIMAFEALQESAEAKQVLDAFKNLRTILPNVRSELRTVRLMGVVPGRCRVCQKFGL